MRCLEALFDLLADGGFILVNDYGETKEAFAEEFEHQHFSQATAVGLNFALLRTYFSGSESARWAEPDEGEASIHARLLGRGVAVETPLRFQECFGKWTQEWLEGPAQRARELGKMGRFQSALGQYREGLARQPFNWALMGEVAHFFTFAVGNAKAGLEMARAALEHNPGCSADLWDVLGESLLALSRLGDARAAFGRALAINADDVRARCNLASVHTQGREYREALVCLGEGLALDRMRIYRQELLGKQGEVLALLEQHQRSYLAQADRVTGPGTLGTSPGRLAAAVEGRPLVRSGQPGPTESPK
jgi:tetratricopeptide (TPR) repeat protein